MTTEGALFLGLEVLLLLNWPVAFILWRAAYSKPRIRALTVMAVLTTLIALGLTVYVLVVHNAALGYPIAADVVRVTFRLVLLGLGLFPVWFLWLYQTGRFNDGR